MPRGEGGGEGGGGGGEGGKGEEDIRTTAVQRTDGGGDGVGTGGGETPGNDQKKDSLLVAALAVLITPAIPATCNRKSRHLVTHPRLLVEFLVCQYSRVTGAASCPHLSSSTLILTASHPHCLLSSLLALVLTPYPPCLSFRSALVLLALVLTSCS